MDLRDILLINNKLHKMNSEAYLFKVPSINGKDPEQGSRPTEET